MSGPEDAGGLPEPPVAEFDLRLYAQVELDQGLVHAPAFAALSAEAWRAQMMLVFAAWREVPACSVPDHAGAIAGLAGFGRDLAAWEAVAEEVLAQWVLCADGRWYFPPMIAAAEAAARRRKSQRVADRQRQARARTVQLMRDVGCIQPDAELSARADDVLAEIEARGGAGLRGARRAEVAAQVCSALGLLPRGGGEVVDARLAAPMRGRGFRTAGEIMRGGG